MLYCDQCLATDAPLDDAGLCEGCVTKRAEVLAKQEETDDAP